MTSWKPFVRLSVSVAMEVVFLGSTRDGRLVGSYARRPDRLLFVQLDDLVFAVSQLTQHLVSVLAQERRAGDLRREFRKLHRAADGPVRAAHLVRDLDDAADLLQKLVVLELLHGTARGGG